MKKSLVSSVIGVAVVTAAVVGNVAPVYAEDYLTPVQKEQCKDYGWITLVDSEGNLFKNQGACVSFVVPYREGPIVD